MRGAAHGSKVGSTVDGTSISVAGTTDEQAVDRFVHRAPVVLVGLVTAEKVEPPPAKGDGRLHEVGDEHDAGREVPGVRIHAGVVVVESPVVVEVDAGRDPAAVDAQEAEADRAMGSEELEEAADEDATRVAAGIRREQAGLTPLSLVEPDERVEVTQRIGRLLEPDVAPGL